MPVVYAIYAAQKFIHTRCLGNVTTDETSDHFRALARDPNCPDRLNVLLDLLEMTSISRTDQIRGVILDLQNVQRRVRFENCAIVADNDAIFGMMRMFEVFAKDYFVSTRVLRGVAEAKAWLAPTEDAILRHARSSLYHRSTRSR